MFRFVFMALLLGLCFSKPLIAYEFDSTFIDETDLMANETKDFWESKGQSQPVYLSPIMVPLKKSKRYPSYIMVTLKVTPIYGNFDKLCDSTPYLTEEFLITLNERPLDGRMFDREQLDKPQKVLKEVGNRYFKSKVLSKVEIFSGEKELEDDDLKNFEKCNY